MKKSLPTVGLIGISGYGRVYLRQLEAALQQKTLNFVAAVVVNREEEKAACDRLIALGVRLYDRWEEMLHEWKGRMDLCLIPVPIHLHESITVAALESGANVLIEKPLAASIEQVQSIQEAEARTGKWVAVGYQDLYSTSAQTIQRELSAGRIGRLRSIRWSGFASRTESYYSRNTWAGKVNLGNLPLRDSPLNNAMAHFLNLSLYWSGITPSDSSWLSSMEAELYRCYPIESFDTAVIRIKTDAGIQIQAATTHCCPTSHPVHMHIVGNEGELHWTHQEKAIWTNQNNQTNLLPLEPLEVSFKAMLSIVLDRLENSFSPIYTTKNAYPQVACIDELHRTEEILAISNRHLESYKRENSSGLFIQGIEADLHQCLTHHALPSELNLPWAKKSSLPLSKRTSSLRNEKSNLLI